MLLKALRTLVSRASRLDDQWREPFLLAVAYQSNENEKIASDIMRALLALPNNANYNNQEHNLLLAAECLIEAKPLSIEPSLETHIAQQLLQTYQVAQQEQRFRICDGIESVMRRWLLSLPREAFRPPSLLVLNEAITNASNIALQRATLTLLSMIAQQLDSCPDLVFNTLIPPLLALTGLPAIGAFQPSAHVSLASDFDIADLALTCPFLHGKTRSGWLAIRRSAKVLPGSSRAFTPARSLLPGKPNPAHLCRCPFQRRELPTL